MTLSDARLKEIAVELALDLIRKGDDRELLIKLEFSAQRDSTGLWYSPIVLGYEAISKASSSIQKGDK